jgi:putative addiction module component (TIGR02574 family)
MHKQWHPSVVDFQQLSVLERLDLIEAIWESIADEADSIVLSEAQKAELDERLDSFYINPEPGQPPSETIEDLRNRV